MKSIDRPHLTSSLKAYDFLQPLLIADVEEFWVVGLTSTKRVVQSRCLFRGTVDSCLVHARDVIRFACISNSSSILVGHNHPSGDCEPSGDDIKITKRLIRACKVVNIPLIDHLIVCKEKYYSFRDHNGAWF